MAHALIEFSIIIPTYNRLEEVKELLQSLDELQTKRDQFEILFIDDGSTDGTNEFFQSYESDLQIHYSRQENAGPGKARNLGMSLARGKYFIFIDSDCLLPKKYLEKVKSALEDESVDAFGGPDTFHPSFSPLLKAINYSMTSFIGTGGTRGHKKSVAKFYPRSFNMGIHRRVYEQVGGFSDLRHGQDMDFSARVFKAGFNVKLFHDVFVYHKRRTSLKKFFKQIFNWGVTRILLSRIHPEMLKPIHFAPAILLLAGLVILILGIWTQRLMTAFLIMGIPVLLMGLIAMFQSYHMYHSWKISILSIMTLYLQVFAYGMGTLSALAQYALGRKEARGFVKNYYK